MALLGCGAVISITEPAVAEPLPPEVCSAGIPLTSDGSTPEGLSSMTRATPDGRYLVYVQRRTIAPSTYEDRIYRVDTATGTNVRVDVASDGSIPAGRRAVPSISADGRYVAFGSDAPLVAGDGDGQFDVFLRDISSSITERVSVGNGLNGGSSLTAVSDDGRYVVFDSEKKLDAADIDSTSDVFVHDRQAGTTTIVSSNDVGSVGPIANVRDISADGRYVLFTEFFDPTQVAVYRRDLTTGTTKVVSEDSSGIHGTFPHPLAQMTADGRFVAFGSGHAFNPEDTTGVSRVYVRDMDSTTFVNMSPEYDLFSGVLAAGDEWRFLYTEFSLAPDGSRVTYPAYVSGPLASQYRTIIHTAGETQSRILISHLDGPADTDFATLINDGTEVIYTLNRVNLAPPGGSATRYILAGRSKVDRALAGSFTVRGPSEMPVTEVAVGEMVDVDVEGYNIRPDTQITFEGTGLELVDIDTSTRPATGTLVAAPDAAGGLRLVTTTAGSGCVFAPTTGVTVLDGTPILSSYSPDRVRPNQTFTVAITGRYLDCPCTVAFSHGITATDVNSDGTSLTMSVTTPAFTVDGRADLSLTNALGKTLARPGFFTLHTAEGEFTPLPPTRILDSRNGTGGPVGQIAQNPRTVQVAGRGGVPGGEQATAVVLNVTVTDPTQRAYVTVWPADVPMPVASNLNVYEGQTVANQVTVPLSAAGQVNVFVSDGAAHVLFDVVGYYSSLSGPPGGRFSPQQPQRLLDTRIDGPSLGPGQTRRLPLFDASSNYAAVVLNITAVPHATLGYLTVTPAGPIPLASSLNYRYSTVANLVTVALSADKAIDIYNDYGTTDVVVDLVGIYGDAITQFTDAAYRPLTPTRSLDTRIGLGGAQQKLGPASSITVDVAGRLGVPADASAVAANVTITNATAAASYLTVWPSNYNRPLTSNVNFSYLYPVPNAVVMGLSESGDLSIFNDSGETDVLMDIAGWFTPVSLGGSAPAASDF